MLKTCLKTVEVSYRNIQTYRYSQVHEIASFKKTWRFDVETRADEVGWMREDSASTQNSGAISRVCSVLSLQWCHLLLSTSMPHVHIKGAFLLTSSVGAQGVWCFVRVYVLVTSKVISGRLMQIRLYKFRMFWG